MTRKRIAKHLKNIIAEYNVEAVDKVKNTNKSNAQLIDFFLRALERQLQEDKESKIHGYFLISRVATPGRTGFLHPITGRVVSVNPYYRVSMQVGARLKKIMKQKDEELRNA